jgi:thymidine kinase
MSRCREHITVITGSMDSGKSRELLVRVDIAEKTNRTVAVFKPSIDTRFGLREIRSRFGDCHHSAIPISDPYEIVTEVVAMSIRPDIVAIDEAQFFGDGKATITEAVLYLAENGYQVLVAGLKLNFRGEPFGKRMSELVAIANENIQTFASCTHVLDAKNRKLCCAPAQYTQRFLDDEPAPYSDPEIVIEEIGKPSRRSYAARCIDHWCVPGMPQRIKFI